MVDLLRINTGYINIMLKIKFFLQRQFYPLQQEICFQNVIATGRYHKEGIMLSVQEFKTLRTTTL